MTQGIDLTTIVQDLPRAEPWAVCPSCDEEWSKLRECFWFEEQKRQTSSICVQCAESLKGFKWITETWPLIAPFDNWHDGWFEAYSFFPEEPRHYEYANSYDLKTKKPFKEKVIMWKMMFGIVKAWYGNKQPDQQPMLSFILRGDMVNTKILAINQKNKEEQVVYDNAIEAWFGMKNRILKSVGDFEKSQTIAKESWGGNQKKFKRF